MHKISLVTVSHINHLDKVWRLQIEGEGFLPNCFEVFLNEDVVEYLHRESLKSLVGSKVSVSTIIDFYSLDLRCGKEIFKTANVKAWDEQDSILTIETAF